MIIKCREVVSLKLKIVSMVRINGQEVKQEDLDPEVFHKLLEEKIDFAMKNVGFEKEKTA